MRTRRYLALVAGAVALGAVLRVAVHLQLAASDPTFDEPMLDGRIFLEWSARIAGGDLLGEGPFFFNPLFPYAFAPVVAAAGDRALGAVRLLQGTLGIATVLLVASATRRLLGRREAAAAALLASAWPATLFLEEVPVGAALGVFLNALALDLLARWRARPTPGRLLGAGAALGFGVLGRPNVALFPLLLPVWLRRLAPAGARGRGTARLAGLLLAGVGLPLLLSLGRNLAVLGEPVLATTNMGVNLHLCNNPLAWETGRMDSGRIPFNPFLLEEASAAAAEAGAGRPLSPTGVSAWWTRLALEDCREDPGRAARFLARKALYFCGSAELPASDSFAQARRDSTLLRLLSGPLAFGLAFPLAALGAAAVFRRRRRALPLPLLVLVYAAGLTLFIPLSHYRAPVLPALLPLAAAGGVDLWDALRGRRRARVGWRVALLAGAALLSHGNALAASARADALGPFPEPASWMLANRSHTLAGRAAEREAAGDREGRDRALRAAAVEARRALAESPPRDNARWLVFAALARIARIGGDFEEEARRLDEALALRPGQPELLADRALNLLRRGRQEEAAAAAREAARAGAALGEELLGLIR